MSARPATKRSRMENAARMVCRHARGFSLIELMVAMLLGLVVTAGVASVFLSNQQVYRAHRALSDVQDSARIAFEMLARDIRHAGLTACSNSHRVGNVLNAGPSNAGTVWWADWNNAIRGYAGNDPVVPVGNGQGARVSGSPSLQVLGGDDLSFSVASHDASAAQFALNESSADLNSGDVFIVCDFDHAAIFQSSAFSHSAKTMGHGTSGGNCSTGLGYPTVCTTTGNRYSFGSNALITRLNVSDWYIGKSSTGGTSLYRLARAGGTPTTQEMVTGVTNMALAYRQSGLATAFVDAASITDWSAVTAVKVTLTMQGDDERAGMNARPISRSFTATTTLRNRVL